MVTTVTETTIGNYRKKVEWEGLACGEDGDSYELKNFNDNTIQVTGTFNSQTVTIQGSNDDTNWFPLKDFTGSDLIFTAAGGGLIAEAPDYIRPSFSGSTGGDIDVSIRARRVS